MTNAHHPVDRLLAEIGAGRGISTDTWTDGARLDATVPHWRFECDGAEAVAAQLSGWYDAPTTIESAVAASDPRRRGRRARPELGRGRRAARRRTRCT